MKVLMINVVCGVKSTGRFCTDLACALEEKGHEVKIAYGREEVPDEYQRFAVRIGKDSDVYRHALSARVFDNSGFGSKEATKKFIQWVKEFDPDIIHLHNIHGYYINIEVLFDFLKSCGKRVIWTLHDCWAFSGHTAYCDVAHCNRWMAGCHDCPLLKEYPASFIDNSKDNWLKKNAVFNGVPDLEIITPSQWLAGLVKKSFLKKYPVRVIHNGIDTSSFKPVLSDFKRLYHLEDKCVLLGVATAWDDNKGLKDYVLLADRLSDKFKVVMVGVNQKQANELPESILKITRTNDINELVNIYAGSDYFLNLSYCENYPTVNLEAICCGTPVITYDTGGSKESIDAKSGCVIEQGDLDTLVDIVSNSETLFDVNHVDRDQFDYQRCLNLYLKEYLNGDVR